MRVRPVRVNWEGRICNQPQGWGKTRISKSEIRNNDRITKEGITETGAWERSDPGVSDFP